MATSSMSEVIQQLRRVVILRDGAGLTDGQLLEDFVGRRDEAALAALVRRHGAMVWGVCRRVLGNYHDAEDAFQASFLVLVRKAASIVPRKMVGNWLYGVAYHTALKARAMAARQKKRERQVTEMPEPAAAEQDVWQNLKPILDEELSRLPDKYRAVIVLCELDGKTRKDAARQLGCPEGTVAGWLARARVMLAKRLARRGVVLSGGALAAVVSQNVGSAAVPTSVVSSTIKAASLVAAGQAAAVGVITSKVALLTEGMLKTMLFTKLKCLTAVTLAVTTVAGIGGGAAAMLASNGGGYLGNRAAVEAKKEASKDQKVKPNRPDSSSKESKEADDAKLIHRTYLDLLGVLPTPDEVKQFQQDKGSNKEKRLVVRVQVRAAIEEALKQLPDGETRQQALEEIEKLVKAMREKPGDNKEKPESNKRVPQ